MAKQKYESVVIFSVKNGEEKAKELSEKFKSLIEANGTLEAVDDWGVRTFAYPINYEKEGYYTVYEFEAEPDFPAELTRQVNITDSAVRVLTIARTDDMELSNYAQKAKEAAEKAEEEKEAAEAQEEPAEKEKAETAESEASEEKAEPAED